jgi:hypothetical protein
LTPIETTATSLEILTVLGGGVSRSDLYLPLDPVVYPATSVHNALRVVGPPEWLALVKQIPPVVAVRASHPGFNRDTLGAFLIAALGSRPAVRPAGQL